MKNKTLLLIAVFAFLIFPAFSQKELQDINFYNTNASINIDGSFNEWDNANLKRFYLRTKQKISTFHESSNPGFSINDIEAYFRCIVDAQNIYFALNVTDDKLISGEILENKKDFWNDDCVEISVDGTPDYSGGKYSRKDDAHLYIYLNKNKETEIFGEAACLFQLPTFFWKAMGIEAIILENEKGYQMEAKIPCHLLGFDQFTQKQEFAFNIAVNDDDDGEFRDSKICWAEDPEDQSYFKPDVLKKCQLNSQLKQIPSDLALEFLKPIEVKVDPISNNKAVLNLTDQKNGTYVRTKMLLDINIARENFNQFTNIDQKAALAIPILLNQRRWYPESKEALLILRSKVETSPLLSQKFVRFNKLVHQYMQAKNLNNAEAIDKEFLDLFGKKILFDGIRYIGNNHYKTSNFEEAIKFHSKILNFRPDKKNTAITYYDLGLSNLYLRDYDTAIDAFSNCLKYKDLFEVEEKHHIVYAFYSLGLSYLRKENKQKAIETWEVFIDDVLKNENFYLKGNKNLAKKRYFIAESMYQIARHSINSDAMKCEKYVDLLKSKFPKAGQNKRLNNVIQYSKYNINKKQKQ